MKSFLLIFFTSLAIIKAEEENVLLTEVFTISLDPSLFNWTYEGDPYQFAYQASLMDAPDLPSWIKYVFSEKHKKGFLYGVPPHRYKARVPLQVVALNKKNYETRIENINIHIAEKLNPAKFEVSLKIDNVNVDDIFNVEKMENLRDIFRKNLWKDSENDLYLTYLESAIELGARKPLDPDQGEGIVLRFGSQSPFSEDLIQLEEEVKPLWKVPSCPRNFKRTSVERFFRDAGFLLDWCAFRLIDPNNSAMHHLSSINENSMGDRWETIDKDSVPTRSYTIDITCSLIIPMGILIFLAAILSFVLCFYHDGIHDQASEDFFNFSFHICTDLYERSKEDDLSGSTQTSSLEKTTLLEQYPIQLSPDPALIIQNHSNSPNATIGRGVHCRPSPPPYVRPRFKPQCNQEDGSKSWYC